MPLGNYATEGDDMSLRRLLKLEEKVSDAAEKTEESLARLDQERNERAQVAAELRLVEVELSNMIHERTK